MIACGGAAMVADQRSDSCDFEARVGRSKQRYDAGGIRLVAVCAAVRKGKVVLISSRSKPEWILPKGGWETDETAEEAARREAREEAGVDGTIGLALGGACRVQRRLLRWRAQVCCRDRRL